VKKNGETGADLIPPPASEDPRPAQTRDLVPHAARVIVASDGQAAVTPTRLVEMSGVARSTIYRHWPDAAAVIVDAIKIDQSELLLHNTGDVEADTDFDSLHAQLVGPLFMQRFFIRAPITDDLISAIVASYLATRP
jgi:AcrR family transcriptional regulator